jgi:hypothetical protein
MELVSGQVGDGIESVGVISLGRIEGKDEIITLVPHSYFLLNTHS